MWPFLESTSRVKWKGYAYHRARIRTIDAIDQSLVAKKQFEPVPSRLKSKAKSGGRRSVSRTESRSSIPNPNIQRATLPLGRHIDICGPVGTRDSMLNGIFDQGLQQHARHKSRECLWINSELHIQSVRKAHALNFEVVVEK